MPDIMCCWCRPVYICFSMRLYSWVWLVLLVEAVFLEGCILIVVDYAEGYGPRRKLRQSFILLL